MDTAAKKKLLDRAGKSTSILLDYCRKNDWIGYDPYDGLTSRLFGALPFLHNRIARLGFMQIMKRNPVNLRRILLVPKSQNSKGIALFSSALLKLSNRAIVGEDEALLLIKRLIESRSSKSKHYCWGYNFDWQTRGFLVPADTPNIICTTVAGNALLDAYDKFGDSSYLEIASSAGDFYLESLNKTEEKDGLCLSYTPIDKERVHNANFLGAAFLARLFAITGKQELLDHALRAARYSVKRQRADGSWLYGESAKQNWIDNFHTGYNLCALRSICRDTKTSEFESNVSQGFDFYRKHFFREDNAPKYFHDRTYPIDIHNVAQSIITLLELKDLDKGNIDLALSVFEWAMAHMWDERGYFYFQIHPYYKIKIPYIRWSQAWMLIALSTLLEVDGQ